MPSLTKRQHNFMAGIAHGMKPRSGHGPSVAVAKDFLAADKGRFQSGGLVMPQDPEHARLEVALNRHFRKDEREEGYARGGLIGKTRSSDRPQARLPFLR